MKSAFHIILRLLSLFLVSAIFVFSMPVQTGSAGIQAKIATNPPASPFDLGWSEGYYINGAEPVVRAVAVDGKKIYIGGDFSVVGKVLANRVAMWDGTGWRPLGDGLNGSVSTLVLDGRGHLYAGGQFTQAGGKPASYIARWDGEEWQPLGTGVDGYVSALAIDSCGNLYVGGSFQSAGGITTWGITRWDGSNWYPLGGGLSYQDYHKPGSVNALSVDRYGFVYAVGTFTYASGKLVNNVARWDGAQWSALGKGIAGELPAVRVQSLAVDGRSKVYVGGEFTTAGGVPVHNLAVWDGENWADLGGGVDSDQTFTWVKSILTDGGDVYIGGVFDFAGGTPVGQIAKWNGSTWEDLNGGVYWEEYVASVHSIALDRDGNLVVGGWFSLAGGKNANQVAIWDGTDWNAFGSDSSVNGNVAAMVSDRQGGFYLAGPFVAAGGQVVNHVAHWDGSAWSDLDGGISGGQYGPIARALALDSHGSLYLGGEFTSAGGVPVNNIAKWVGDHWEALGNSIQGTVTALVIDSQDNLYVGGLFDTAGGIPASKIAKWTGTSWEALGSGLSDPFASLAVDAQNRLVAGGNFSTLGEANPYNLTRWDGSTWEILDSQYRGPVSSLLVDGDTLYLGGSQVWMLQDGFSEPLGGDFSNGEDKPFVFSLALDAQGRLVAGGQFTQAGDIPANNIARWDGNRWEPLGNGTNGVVKSLLPGSQGNLLVGGEFTQAGGRVSVYLASWKDPFVVWMPEVYQALP